MTYSQDVLDLNPELAIGRVPASKCHHSRTVLRGLEFQSGHEAEGCVGLVVLEEHYQIFGLRFQVRFPLAGKTFYLADAVYLDKQLQPHIVDFKGVRTEGFRIKRRLFKERYDMEIEEL